MPSLRAPLLANGPRQFRRDLGSITPPRRTFLASSRCTRSHYDTLAVPRNATRAQIKTQFYKVKCRALPVYRDRSKADSVPQLSKKHHPDLNDQSPSSVKEFQRLSEAYAVLGDDRSRRAYDSSMAPSSPTPSSSYTSGAAHESHGSSFSNSYYASTASERRARAKYAWEYSRRTQARPSGSNYHRPNPFASARESPEGSHASHFARMAAEAARRASAGASAKAAKAEQFVEEEERLRNDGALWRLFRVVGLFGLVFWLGSGFRVSADEGADGVDVRWDEMAPDDRQS